MPANENKTDAILNHLVNCFVKREKIVPIIGAGVSIPAGVPSGYYLIQMLQRSLNTRVDGENFGKRLGPRAAEVRKTLEQTATIPSFEWILKVYSDVYDEKILHGQLSRLIPAKHTAHRPKPYFPTFTHELFAHFVGTGHLKYFITSNFDELLETAIEDELGPGSCFTVASQSEFDRLANWSLDHWEEEIRDPRIGCFILKPHGTISRRLSMRYTPEVTSLLTDEKTRVLQTLLADSTVLLLGFGNYNEDFRQIFAMSTIKTLYVVDPKANEIAAQFPFPNPGSIYKYPLKADEFCRELTQRLYNAHMGFPHRAKPVRHELRASFFDIFSRSLADQERDEESYHSISVQIDNLDELWFARRLYELELLIYLFKTRGLFVDLAVASCERIHRALERCSYLNALHSKTDDLRPFTVLDQMLNGKQEKILDSSVILDRLGVEALAAKWIFLVTSTGMEQSAKVILADLSTSAARNVTRHLTCRLRAAGVNVESDPWPDRLQTFNTRLIGGLTELSTTFDIDIAKDDFVGGLKFFSPMRIATREDFASKSTELLKGEQWNRIRIATVGAEWHAQQLRSLAGTSQRYWHIEVMSNLDMFTEKQCAQFCREPDAMYHYHRLIASIAELLIGLSCRENVELDWYAYRNLEHHLTLTSKTTRTHSPDETLIGGIYFQRQGKSTSVAPVFVEGKRDLQMLATYYDNRVKIAKRGTAEDWNRGICKLFGARKIQNKLVVEISNRQKMLLILHESLETKLAGEIARGDIELNILHPSTP